MSLFGGIEIDDIPESIKKGKYVCELKKVRHYESDKDSWDIKLQKTATILDFEVVQEDSEFVTETGSVFINGYGSPELGQDPQTKQILFNGEPLPPEIQQDIRKSLKFYKTLCNSMKYDKDEISKGTVNFAEKIGERFYVTMFPNANKKTQVSQGDPIVPVKGSNTKLDDLEDI